MNSRFNSMNTAESDDDDNNEESDDDWD